jgi:D-amino-acid dehydrogenase
MLCRTQKALDEESHLVHQALEIGIQAETLSARDLANLEPNVTLDVVGAVRFGNDCHLSPEKFLGQLQSSLEQKGARFLWSHTTTGWETTRNSISAVQTSQGPVHGDVFVLCGGIQSPHIARQLQLCLPLLAGKGYSLTLPHPGQSPHHCAILTEARVAVTPINTTLRVGGTMELGSTKSQPNPKRIQGITRSFCQYFPAFTPDSFTNLPIWTGLRPVSPDGLPYLGPTSKWNNLQIATGHAMLGLSLGPVTGQIIAQLIDENTCPHNLQLLHPDRFG